MPTIVILLLLLVVGVATYAMRLSFIVAAGRVELPGRVRRVLRFVPVAALTALIVPGLLLPQGTLALGLDNERLLAGLVAVAVAWRTRHVLLTIVAGMASLWLLQALTG